MKDSASPKQQIIQSIKDANNILIAVSADPSVDELSAALGLTLFLNKLDKHATTVFSGKIPPAITFLEPDKTFEGTVDSLRDFIIALDKEKADHLRYKVVDNVVKIFITPYRTSLSEKDLEFSQGDYNVELVLALNVDKNEHLDAALTAHGRILHDADIATVTSGDITSSLGSIDWHEKNASGVSEMLTEIISELKTPKVVLDEQMANALLTGIVAATDRFSNDLTSSRVMTAAAELMAAGANQQLIVNKLAESQEKSAEAEKPTEDEHKKLDEGQIAKLDKSEKSEKSDEKPKKAKKKPKDDGSLAISHEKKGSADEVARQVQAEQSAAAAQAAQDKLDNLKATAETKLETAVEAPKPPEIGDIKSSSGVLSATAPEQPSMGGVLNATSDQAAKDKQREAERDQNRTILSHGQQNAEPESSPENSPLNAAMAGPSEPKAVDPFKGDAPGRPADEPEVSPKKTIQPLGSFDTPKPESKPVDNDDLIAALTQDTEALSDTPTAPVADDKQSALKAVDEALNQAPAPTAPTQPAAPAVPSPATPPTLADLEKGTSHGLPPMPDFSTLPPPPPPPTPVGVATNNLPNIAAPQPKPAPTPSPAPAPAPSPSAPGKDFNPSQFQIPGSK
ncbi:hypothetical protein CR969_01240 [Candidatus Saccharibacteria bacterium]|nr:MAG: hypothetical protein CR969_01240 [Candidatus Saccharibacteria bacterium]